MGSIVKVVFYFILTVVGVYCGYLIMKHYSLTLSQTVSTVVTKLERQKHHINQVFLGTEGQSDGTQNLSSINKTLVGTQETSKTQSAARLRLQPVQDLSEVIEFSSKESQHTTAIGMKTPKSQPDKESQGYILPYSIFEEQSNGAKNLWQLQIWANMVNMHVVEPFAINSVFTMMGIAPNFGEALRFGDYFDIEKWNEMVVKTFGSPLVQWEEFIAKAPRDAILLYMTRSKTTIKPLTIVYDDDVDDRCLRKGLTIPKSDLQWINQTFNITKRVCYLFAGNKPHALTISKFKSIIFGDLMPNRVSLIIRSWMGIRPSRISITPMYAFMPPFSMENLAFPPSTRVLKAYKSYTSQYIGSKTYVGIVFRSHHVLFYNKYGYAHNFTGMSQKLLQCSKQLKDELDKIRAQHEIFLAIDLGTFGSKKYSASDRLVPLRDQIHFDIFNGSLPASQREERLKNASGGITDCGFIAQLEKVIATNANCIILLGRKSGFVSSSLSLYLKQHPVDRCVVSICYQDIYNNDANHTLLSSHHIPDKFIY